MGKEKDDKRRNEKGERTKEKWERRNGKGERQQEKEKTSRWNDQSGKSLSYCC